MAFVRRDTDKDATWQRAWTADTHADLADINAILGPNGPRHGDVAFVTDEGSYFWWQDNGTWLHLAEGSGGLFGVGQWIFNNNILTAPTSNQIRFNANYPYSAVTALKLTSLTDEGVDAHAILVALPIGTTILVQDKNDSTQSAKFISNGVSIDNTTWVQIPVAHLAHGNSLSNNQATIVRATGPGTGNVTGPASSTDDHIALFDGVTGQLLKDSGVDIDDVAIKEIGTWTPVLDGLGGVTGQTYSAQIGEYVKVGDLALVGARILLTNKGTITGAIIISGLPFVARNTTGANQGSPVSYFADMATAFCSLGGIVQNNGTFAVLFGVKLAAQVSAVALDTTDITNTTDMVVTIAYRVEP